MTSITVINWTKAGWVGFETSCGHCHIRPASYTIILGAPFTCYCLDETPPLTDDLKCARLDLGQLTASKLEETP